MFVVTIDGPAGAGKSTVSRRLAERLGWRLLDTGAMYRAVALAALRTGVDLGDVDAVGALAEQVDIEVLPGRILLDGEDVTDALRTVAVTRAVQGAAGSPRARRRLVALQRAFAAAHDLVTEGRDQGTVVFPEALCKFFLTALPEVRAQRRHAEFAEKGEPVSSEAVLNDLAERDQRDATRALAPMTPAPDAAVVDTTGMTLEQVVDALEAVVRSRLASAGAGKGVEHRAGDRP